MIRAHKVERDKCKPMNGVNAVGEQDESCFIEPSRTLSCFERSVAEIMSKNGKKSPVIKLASTPENVLSCF